MKKLLLLFCFLSLQVFAGDLIFKAGFENSGLVSGNVNGLTGTGLSLSLTYDSDTEILTITENGQSIFFDEVPVGTNWTVTINNQPIDQSCSLHGNSGTMVAGGTNSLIVTCGDVLNNWNEMNWDQGNWQ